MTKCKHCGTAMVAWGCADRRFLACPNEDCTATGPIAPDDVHADAAYRQTEEFLVLCEIKRLLESMIKKQCLIRESCKYYAKRIDDLERCR
jgi:ssDNA-binding Zn-finger/Zn-ribbon topoisomerase 1